MKNVLVSAFIFICVTASAAEAHAFDLHDLSYPYPPVLSPAIDILPQGFITINTSDETYYYSNGIFYQKVIRDQKYVITPAPIGAVVFTIPQGYQYMFIGGEAYYVYEGVYYKRVLEGYKVIYPPL